MNQRNPRQVLVLMLTLGISLILQGCADPVHTDDGGPDGDPADGDVDGGDGDGDSDGDADGDVDGDGDGDGDADGDTPPAEILREGSAGLILRGTVLTPTGVLEPGEVFVVDDTIHCVAADCSGEAGASDATLIETHGIISPGLVDSHNHMAYNFLPEWIPDPPQLFSNRYEWTDEESYRVHKEPYSTHSSSNSHYCPGAKWGELRSLVHGTTTIQGQPSAAGSCINWGIRNANRYHGLGHDHMGQDIGSVRDITDADADGLVAHFTDTDEPWTRAHWHMAEGVSGVVLEEFDSFAGRDPRDNRHQGLSLLDWETAILIHSIPLTTSQLDEVERTGAMIAWSPSSNFALYGETAPIEAILERDIVTGIGPDWTMSGEDEMLSELRYCLAYGRDESIGAIDPQRLWEMATLDGAELVGLGEHIGQLAPGFRADIAVFGRAGSDPYLELIESRASAVRLVLIDGAGFYGDANLQTVTARNEYCESFDACGTEKYICVQDSPTADRLRDETLDDIETQLFNILEGIGYPEDEQYGRGDELLPLVDCSL